MIIRKATISDADVIIDFQKKMALETENLTLVPDVISKGVRAVFSNPVCGQYWVAEDQGTIIASLLITSEWSDWRNCFVWWFQSVYVLPAWRRKGIFRAMYLTIRQEADNHNVAGLRLYVEVNNLKAQKTYEAMGMDGQHYRLFEWLK